MDKQDTQHWNGEGLPPVGCKVEFIRYKGFWYRESSPNDGQVVEIVAHYRGAAVCCWPGNDDVNCSEIFTGASFRPIRTSEQIEAERRERVTKQMFDVWNQASSICYQKSFDYVYDAIRAGKIEGVKIDG